ncbi:MAG: hypothetical protein ACOZFS_07735 [Thermodesulfobacteriota bacterium]
MTQAAAIVTVPEVEQIAAQRDPILRNLQITQCYHELSASLAGRTGPSANWCTFATWASKQAGQTIRQEDLSRAVKAGLPMAPEIRAAVDKVAEALKQLGAKRPAAELQALVWDAVHPAAALNRASGAVARGNLKVFAEIGREFARFNEMCLADEKFLDQTIEGFCAVLRPGDPPGGQGYLKQAFRSYYRSFFETDSKVRAELLLLANTDIGFHEQTRLQPEITDALDAPLVDPREFVDRLLQAAFPGRSGITALVGRLLRRLFGRLTPLTEAAGVLWAAARQQVRRIISEHLMTLTLPLGVRLSLGQDLKAQFPPSLEKIVNPELQGLLARLDPSPDSLRATGASDWADLPERLHFIIDLFRCYQEAPELLEPPFRPEQVAAFKAGRLPAGEL